MQREVSYHTSVAALQILKGYNVEKIAAAVGVTPDLWDTFTGNEPWKADERHLIKRAIDGCLYGLMDHCGIPHMQIPAEWAASIGALMVSGQNLFHYAQWCGAHSSADDLASYRGPLEEIEGLERVTNSQLFALMLKIRAGKEIDSVAKAFKQKFKSQIGYQKE